MIKDYASTGLPLLLSCGMADQDEIHQSLNAVGALDGYPTVLLLTTSLYPTPPNEVNLLKLKTLEKIFPDIPLGYSDHTQGSLASSLAVASGAVVFEKHFTLDKKRVGLDHSLSADPIDLKIICDYAKSINDLPGKNQINPSPHEKKFTKFFYTFWRAPEKFCSRAHAKPLKILIKKTKIACSKIK